MGERSLVQELPGIALNRVRPVLDAVEEDTRELSELLRSYSLGLDVLRDTATRVVSRNPLASRNPTWKRGRSFTAPPPA